MSTPTCAAPCDCPQPAVAAVHPYGNGGILVRPNHLTELFAADWRCLDHVLDAVEDRIATAHHTTAHHTARTTRTKEQDQ